MSIKFTCPNCRAEHSVPDDKAGTTGKCGCGTLVQVPATSPSAMTLWNNAIAAAESGARDQSLRHFQAAIKMDPDYYVSVIQPSSSAARPVWEQAVRLHIDSSNAAASRSSADPRHCQVCGQDVGTNWH